MSLARGAFVASLVVLIAVLAPAPPGGTAAAAEIGERQEEQPKKKSKKRVRATLVPSEPTAAAPEEPQDSSGEAEEAKDQASPEAADTTSHREAGTTPDSTSTRSPTTSAARDPLVLAERVDVIEVLLDVLVTRGGEPATGLRPEDFVVEEEGRPVEVTSLSYYSTPDELSSSGDDGTLRTDRFFILFFHDQSRHDFALRAPLIEAGRAAQRWIAEERLPNDQVAVLAYDVKLKVYLDFSRDSEAIQAAIGNAATGRKEPDWSRLDDAVLRQADSPSLLLNLPRGRELRRETRVFQRTLGLVGRAAEGIVGRKNLVLISLGFGDTQGGIWTPDLRYYPDMEESLNAGNVAVYPVYTTATRTRSLSGAGISNSLNSIAVDTGGLFYDAFVNFATPLRRIATDNRGYYLLSYRAEVPAGAAGYRDVEVRTVERGYDVRYRRGYRFGGTEDEPATDR
ncbi:MAG: VWA domain-containing protein [Thermoanaerobaculia bacterium]|nr:VWA domain-containing protein [Thermoanaerobaculia bacterium]